MDARLAVHLPPDNAFLPEGEYKIFPCHRQSLKFTQPEAGEAPAGMAGA
jgi:hypothetical protein